MANFKNFHQVNFSYCADKSNNNPTTLCCPHLPSHISNTLLTPLTHATTFSWPSHVENYAAAAATNLDGQSWTYQAAQNAQAPIQGSNTSGSVVTALSCANEFDAGGALGGDGSIAASPITCPPSTTMTTFLQHQHTVPHAVPTSLMAAATHPMLTTSAAATACLTAAATTTCSTAVAATTCSTAMAMTTHLTAAAAGLKYPYNPATTPTTEASAHQRNAAAQHPRHRDCCSNLKTVRRSSGDGDGDGHSMLVDRCITLVIA